MSFVKLGDLNFYYEVFGSGTPLILISGLSCDSSHWNLIRDVLVEKFQVIFIDNRSVGRTDVPDQYYTISDMAGDVVGLLHHLGINKASFIGHSMGGAIAQTIAYKYPSIINKLIISNSFIKIKQRSLIFMRNLAKMYFENYPLNVTVSVNAPWIFSDEYLNQPNVIDDMINYLKSYPYPQSAKGFSQQVEAISQFNSQDWVNKITVPTLVIAGEEDYLTPLENSKIINSQIINSKLIIQPGAHVPMIEIPQQYVSDILAFLIAN